MHNRLNLETDGVHLRKTRCQSCKNRILRARFTWGNQNWTTENKVGGGEMALSDISQILLQCSDGTIRIWSNQHESMDPSSLSVGLELGLFLFFLFFFFPWEISSHSL